MQASGWEDKVGRMGIVACIAFSPSCREYSVSYLLRVEPTRES